MITGDTASGIITMFLCGTAEAQPYGRVLGQFRAWIGAVVAEGSSPRCGDRDRVPGSRGTRQLSRSEPRPLTGTASNPLTETGRLHWGCGGSAKHGQQQQPEPSKPSPTTPEELPGELTVPHSRSPHAQNGGRPRPKMAAAPPRRAPSPSPRPRRPPALPVRSRRAAVPASAPPSPPDTGPHFRPSLPVPCGSQRRAPGALCCLPHSQPTAMLAASASLLRRCAVSGLRAAVRRPAGPAGESHACFRPSRRSLAAVRARAPGPAGSEAAGPGVSLR